MPQQEFEKLVAIIYELRQKCPWDKQQTIHTLRQMTIEETYELNEAILTENWCGIKEELGDILLHVIFYATIAAEKKQFNIAEVIHSICDKLVFRHPHIYNTATNEENKKVTSAEEVKKNWEQSKLKEGKKSILSGLPKAMPAIEKSMRIQEKAKQVGFEWEHKEDVWKKVMEEIQELQDAVHEENKKHQEEELGDVLFSIVNYARFLHIDAGAALERTNQKFINRFNQMEDLATKAGKNLNNMNLHEMDALWNKIKSLENK